MTGFVDDGEYAPRELPCCGCRARTMRRDRTDRRAICIECARRRWQQVVRRLAGAEPYRLHF